MIFKRFDHDESVNALFEKTKFDLIQQISDYNENNWINHFTCFHIKAEFVYTHFKKNDCLKIIKSFLHMIKTRYNQIVRFFRMNDESILNEKFNLIIQTYEITAKRTAFYTFDQNEKIERSEKILIIKTKIMRISNHLSKNLWSEIYKIDDYINNRILKRNLKWLTLYETLFEKKFNLFHLHLYDCRAYFFRQKIFKKNKLKSRAIINYFVDYDSINIFRIWMLSKAKMIKTKNVIFDHSKFYDFIELNLIHILIFLIKSIVEMLNLSKMQLTFNEIEKFEKFEKNFIFIKNVEQLNEISSIKNIITKSIEKKNLKKTRTLMSIFEITSKTTSKRIVI